MSGGFWSRYLGLTIPGVWWLKWRMYNERPSEAAKDVRILLDLQDAPDIKGTTARTADHRMGSVNGEALAAGWGFHSSQKGRSGELRSVEERLAENLRDLSMKCDADARLSEEAIGRCREEVFAYSHANAASFEKRLIGMQLKMDSLSRNLQDFGERLLSLECKSIKGVSGGGR
jgi:hypothetical protein